MAISITQDFSPGLKKGLPLAPSTALGGGRREKGRWFLYPRRKSMVIDRKVPLGLKGVIFLRESLPLYLSGFGGKIKSRNRLLLSFLRKKRYSVLKREELRKSEIGDEDRERASGVSHFFDKHIAIVFRNISLVLVLHGKIEIQGQRLLLIHHDDFFKQYFHMNRIGFSLSSKTPKLSTVICFGVAPGGDR